MALQFGGIGRERAWDQLARVPDFRGIEPSEFDEMLAYMVRRHFLFEAGGLLSLGERGERVYGRRNFMELYAVFSTPLLPGAHTGRRGDRSAGADLRRRARRGDDELSTRWSGAARSTISHSDRAVTMTPAPRGKKPTWGGFAPKLIGYEICQQVRRLLEGDAPVHDQPDRSQIALRRERPRPDRCSHTTHSANAVSSATVVASIVCLGRLRSS